VFFAGPAVVLEPLGSRAKSEVALATWKLHVQRLCAALGWRAPEPVVRQHADGALLCFASAGEHMFTATEVNEWAWEQASGLFAPGSDSEGFEAAQPVLATVEEVVELFRDRAAAETERMRGVTCLQLAARARGLASFFDDEVLSIGSGAACVVYRQATLPRPDEVPWSSVKSVPIAMVTGSNGKTTTVRLIAACAAAAGLVPGYSSTEGVVIAGEPLQSGDYSGPAGARAVLRDTRVQLAVLETARGGILRRGLALEAADVAVVTNIAADHFGEYGIDSLEDLADVKLVVAHALGNSGTLVLNADDAVLLARAATQTCEVALFALDYAHPALLAARERGAASCGVQAATGHLWLSRAGTEFDLGAVAAMPIALDGAALHNVANLAASALAAAALGIAPSIIASTFARFGSSPRDNAGRLERWAVRGVIVLVDYAHNPEGLAGLLGVAARLLHEQVPSSRLGLLLGQAGNRNDAAIGALAKVAASSQAHLIVLKELPHMLRGRAPGEVPALLRAGLAEAEFKGELQQLDDELLAARRLLAWAQPGDVVVLPIHSTEARDSLSAHLAIQNNI
jgi:cyanophycin synthetase